MESRGTASALVAASAGRALRRRCWPRSPSAEPTRWGTHTAPRAAPPYRCTSSVPGRARSSTGSRIPVDAHQVLLHVRDYTKGHPRIAANNHPVRHGAVVGVHNGIILNDDELMARHGYDRAEPEMTVDSEVIFAAAEATGSDAHAFEEFHGSMAAAWLDERRPELLYLARGTGRPLWVGTTRHELFFASTEHALEIAERYTGLRLRKREVPEGTLAAVKGARAVRVRHFTPDPYLPARSPAGRARPAGGRVVPRAPRRARHRTDVVAAFSRRPTRRARRSRRRRAAARARGTGRSTRRPSGRRTSGTPATRSAASGRPSARPPSR